MQKAIVITEQPVSVSVPVGYSFTLRCRAEACTSLQYQWFCQHQSACCQIPGATEQDLLITAQQTQLYTCRINDLHKNAVFSNWVKVEVHQCVARGLLPQLWRGEPVIILNPAEQKVEVGKPLQLRCAAMGVPAPNYQWYRNGNVLEHQKRKKLWINHAKVSDSGTYLCCASNSHGEHWTNAVDIHVAIFYYAGHGYEHLGRNYMVPIDAPQPYAPENCISVQRILQKMQQRQTALNLILLDTCRKWYNPECPLSQVQPLEPWGNTVYGYATSEDAEAYELQDGEFSSGIFMKYLKKHILQEKKVTHMLEDVLEDIGRDPLVTGKQVMEIKHTLKEARALTDPVCPSGAAAARWGRSYELLSEIVTFPCGARVELRFHQVFSNVIYVCAKLQALPAHIADVRLLLCWPTERQGADILKDSCPNQVESLLASVCKQEEQDCVFQLNGLQKIQMDVLLQLDLHYTQLSTKQRTCESLQKILQKSLVAQLFSHRNSAQPNYQQTPVSAGSLCLRNMSTLSAGPKAQASLRMGSGHSLPSSNPSNSCSEPEENDESNLSELCSALLRAGPGQDCP
ncbi:mucosa-associated lymphoid tissue lymphoma translocation protein 1-like isoform X4 [Struthio camelus]|uniref:mucosa-associated lymphoid tissue lymphoma translocation protein 1-like isoform X4 n=1 Tax=Struthio camelus TaxID=8801 RepID=UPI00051E5BF8|nr:PREDICTED: mucosa-associated lymphoid tissue lymphoma translocation protein 1-like isoform X3 [Struthio camelus australis]